MAIARYVANKFGFCGKTEIEKAKCDMIADQLADMQAIIQKIYTDLKDEKELDIALKHAADETIPYNLKFIENILAANKDGDGYLVGNSLTYADLLLMYFYDILRDDSKAILSKLPLLNKHNEKIRSLPKVAEHLEKNAHVRVSIKW